MRLNAAVREEITTNATKVLHERRAALYGREHVLAEECYACAVPRAQRTATETLHRIDASWLYTTTVAAFNVAGQHIRLTFAEAVAVPHRYQSYNPLGKPITMETHPSLVTKVRALQADWETFKKDLHLAETTLKAVLKGVGSTETLFKVWPEGKKFYSTPPLTPQVKTGVPALQMQTLNTMLGLHA